jgi:hypothetical protein
MLLSKKNKGSRIGDNPQIVAYEHHRGRIANFSHKHRETFWRDFGLYLLTLSVRLI